MPICFTSLEDSTTVDNVLAFLELYVSYTLGLIGNIVNSRPQLVKAIKVYTPFEVGFSKPNQARSTSPLYTGAGSSSTDAPFSPPALFSIIAFQPREQARFFYSADLKNSEPATPNEEVHVQEFFKELIPIVATFPPDNPDGPALEFITKLVGVRGRGYHIGRVHEKWAPCLDPITIQRSGPLVCLIRPPPPSPPLPLPREVPLSSAPSTTGAGHDETPDRKSDRWIISRFSPSDIDFIQSTSLIPRHKAYLESRAHTSISVHDSYPIDANPDRAPSRGP